MTFTHANQGCPASDVFLTVAWKRPKALLVSFEDVARVVDMAYHLCHQNALSDHARRLAKRLETELRSFLTAKWRTYADVEELPELNAVRADASSPAVPEADRRAAIRGAECLVADLENDIRLLANLLLVDQAQKLDDKQLDVVCKAIRAAGAVIESTIALMRRRTARANG